MYDEENNDGEDEFKMDDNMEDLDPMDPMEKEDFDDDPEDRYH